MLGFKLVILLVLTVVSASVISNVYADPIFVKFDKTEYQTGDSLSITGQISEFKMPVIAMSIFDPDGKILSANNVEVEPDGLFVKTIFLDAPFYEKSGQYKIKFDYVQITQNEFFTISSSETVPETVEEQLIPELTSLTTSKPQYTDNDTITVVGSVSTLDSPTVLIGIYDTFGTPAGFYFGQVDSNLKFSASFLAKAGVNFKVDGTYSIKAHYAESSATTTFDFYKVLEQPEETIETIDEPIDETTNEQPEQTTASTNTESNTDTNSDTTNNTNQNEPSIVKTNEVIKDEPSTAKETVSKNESIIQTTKKTNPTPSDNTSITKTESKSEKNTQSEKSNDLTKEDNLTVEDIELGLILNQINLKCDSSKYTDTITYYDGMGPALYRLCKFESSLNSFESSLLTDPDNVEILTNKGSTLGKLGHFSEAIVYYDEALDIDSEFLPAINNKANALANLGKYDEAKSLYESALDKNPNYLTARKNLALLNSELPLEKNTLPEQQLPIKKTNDNTEKVEFVALEKPKQAEPKEKTPNFFEEFTSAFSSLGSLFGFLN